MQCLPSCVPEPEVTGTILQFLEQLEQIGTILQFCLVCHPISKWMWFSMIQYNFKKMHVDWHWLNHRVEVGTYLPCLRHLLDLSDIFQYQLHLTQMNLGHRLSLSTFNCGSNTSFLLDFPQYSHNTPWKHFFRFPWAAILRSCKSSSHLGMEIFHQFYALWLYNLF